MMYREIHHGKGITSIVTAWEADCNSDETYDFHDSVLQKGKRKCKN